MLRLIRRHLKACPHSSSLYRRCRCPIHVYGTLGGQKVRRAVDQTSWEAATTRVHAWEKAGRITDEDKGTAISEAVSAFLHDLEHGQHRKPATLAKHRNLLEKRLLPWCETSFHTHVHDLDLPALRTFRATWPDAPLTALKNLERLRSFFAFCVASGWIAANPATELKAPSSGKPSERVKVFSAEQITAIIDACDRYPQRNSYGLDNQARVKAFVLVLRYSGLRIGDVVGLRRDHLDGDRIFLRTMKTGESVYLPLPPVAVTALSAVTTGDDYFFWSGRGLRKSAVADWQRALRRVFKLAKVKGTSVKGNPHMFRHTFATDLLTRGVPIEDVAGLLGHATPAVTMRYYSHWVKARRERLEERVKALWHASA